MFQEKTKNNREYEVTNKYLQFLLSGDLIGWSLFEGNLGFYIWHRIG